MHAWDKREAVSTGCTERIHDAFLSFLGEFVADRDALKQIDGRSADHLGSVGSSPSHADEAGGRNSNIEEFHRIATKPKPRNWNDTIHEQDGGFDEIGPRPQDGRQILVDEIMGVMQRDGVATAWDDVTNKNLDHEKVMEARRAEMEWLFHVRDLKVQHLGFVA